MEKLIIGAVRVLGALPVLRWAFVGGLVAIAADGSDVFLMNLLDLGGLGDYQHFDKFADQAYLLTFLVVALRWQGPPRSIALGLYASRPINHAHELAPEQRSHPGRDRRPADRWFLFVAS